MQEEINKLKQEIEQLRNFIYKNDFSNLYVYTTPVQFKRPNKYPKNDTAIATSTTDSTGKIAVDIDGTTRYIPYY